MMEAMQLEKQHTSLSGLHGPVILKWPALLEPVLQQEILDLMNMVIEKEDTIGFPEPLSQQEGAEIVGALAKAVEKGDKHLLLMFDQETGIIVGHLILTPSALPNCRHVAEISRVFVHPAYRGVSSIRIGLREVLDKCDRIGIETITLDVRANTRIHKLWTALGFDTIGLMQDYARVNGKSYAGCYMYQSVTVLKDRIKLLSS